MEAVPEGLDLLYFAWVREAVGRDGERIARPAPETRLLDIVAGLRARGGGYAEAFAAPDRLRAALDQRFVSLETPLGEARELALFPPVTGG